MRCVTLIVLAALVTASCGDSGVEIRKPKEQTQEEWLKKEGRIPRRRHVRLPECQIEKQRRAVLGGRVVASHVLSLTASGTIERLCWSGEFELGAVPATEIHGVVRRGGNMAYFAELQVDLLPIRNALVHRFGDQYEAIEIRMGKELTPVHYSIADPYAR